MSEWRRPYEVHRWYEIVKVVPFLVVLYLVFSGTGAFRGDGVTVPFLFGIDDRWWLFLLNPWFDLLVPLVILTGWLRARNGVYVSDSGVMVRSGFRRIVVPWHEIAYAGLAQVPNYRVNRHHEPHLGLTLVTPAGEPRPLPVRVRFAGWDRGGPRDFLLLTDEPMAQVVNCINDLAARHRI